MSKVSNRGRLSVVMLLAVAFVFSAACKKNANTGNTGTSNAGGTTTTTTTGGTTTGGAGTPATSPTAALRAYYEAGMKKDVAGAKRYLSAGSIRVLEEGAQKMGMSLDEAMKQNAETSTATMPEFANERISGDTATVDIKAGGDLLTMHMVKEGGEWKLAMDKVLEDLKRKAGAGGATTTQSQPEGGDDDAEDEHGGHEDK